MPRDGRGKGRGGDGAVAVWRSARARRRAAAAAAAVPVDPCSRQDRPARRPALARSIPAGRPHAFGGTPRRACVEDALHGIVVDVK